MGSNPVALKQKPLQARGFIAQCGPLRDSTERQPDATREASAARRPEGLLPKALEGIPSHS